MLKETLDETAPWILSIINTSIQTGVVPDIMKRALVTPLLKKPNSDPDIFKNYRPVSNLSFVSKVLEKIVSKRLTSHMDTYGLHDPLQSAYKAGHSTETALLRIHSDLAVL